MRKACVMFLVLIVCAARSQAQQTPYDLIEQTYAPYTSSNDPLGFPMKVRSLTANPYKFWRGSRELFWAWCATNCRDWMSDAAATIPCHGDPHFGNLGAYASAPELGRLAFGMVDFDDSHRLPFQYELLQGIITFRLVAEQNHIELSDRVVDELIAKTLDNYGSAAASRETATQLLAGDRVVRPLLTSDRPYDAIRTEYLQDDRFRSTIADTKGKLKEVLRPAMNRSDELANAIAIAAIGSPTFGKRLRWTDRASIHAAIIDAAQRTRIGSSGSQGLKKYLVLLRRPLKDFDGDAIFYLKPQIPSAAERAGFASRDPRDPAQRCVDDIAGLTNPPPYLCGWGNAGGESYWITLFEPWSEELDAAGVGNLEDLQQYARIWATTAGASHASHADLIQARLQQGEAIGAILKSMSGRYLSKLNSDYQAFTHDPRTNQQLKDADVALNAAKPN